MATVGCGLGIGARLFAATFLAGSFAGAQTTGQAESRIVTNSDMERYEAMYGVPQYVALEELLSGTVPLSGAIRTRGILEASPRVLGQARRYALSSNRSVMPGRLPITPGTPIRDNFDFDADPLNQREVEIVGTYERGLGADAHVGGGFWFWSYSAAEPRSRASGMLAIEDLVARPADLAKETVRVRGQFRGRNLFGDVAAAGAPADGWVIKDGGYAVWVSGKRPRGDGWSLDPDNRCDSRRWVEVEGRIEAKGEVTWLKASKVALVPAPKGEAQPECASAR